jgi:hypothetical protein
MKKEAYMMKTGMVILLCCFLLIPAMSLADTMGPIEYNTDRNGSDYSNFELPDHVPQLCRDACLNDPKCMAWTLVRPGITGPKAQCWLKNAVPRPVSNPDCTSGIKSPPMEHNIDRPGADYNEPDLLRADPKLCQDACTLDPECKAWTYAAPNCPGITGPKAHCWLKNAVPKAVPNKCCTSGTKPVLIPPKAD